MPANFNPEMSVIKDLKPFKFWCSKVLPSVYDDSLSYYELLTKVLRYLNDTMESVETLNGNVENIYNAYLLLEDYVNNYFETADFEAMVNARLDEMAIDGTLTRLIGTYVDPIFQEKSAELDREMDIRQSELYTMIGEQNSAIESINTQINEFLANHAGPATHFTLWSGYADAEDMTIELSDAPENYEFIEVYFRTVGSTYAPTITRFPAENFHSSPTVSVVQTNIGTSSNDTRLNEYRITLESTDSVNTKLYRVRYSNHWLWDGVATDDAMVYSNNSHDSSEASPGIVKIVGIKQAQQDTEIVNAHIGANGVTYPTIGQAIRSVDELYDIMSTNSFDINEKYCSHINSTQRGVTYTWVDENVCNVTGELTQATASFNNLFQSQTSLPAGVNAGDWIHVSFDCNTDNIYLNILEYRNGATAGAVTHICHSQFGLSFKLDETCTGLFIRFQTNTVVGQQFNDTISNVKIMKAKTNNEIDNELYQISTYSTNNTLDRSTEIQQLLNTNKHVTLSHGVYYLSNIVMPDDSVIEGQGASTKIYLRSGGTYAFKLGSRCTIKNVAIYGSDEDHTANNSSYPKPSNIGTIKGIVWEGTYNTDSNTPRRSIIDGCYIANFDNSGIYMHDTGTNVVTGISISNTYIWYCYAGINMDYSTEFNKISNCAISNCYYGVVNNGGNNMLSNCVIARNRCGMLIDNSSSQSPNRGHGSVENCNFDHSDENTGYGVEILGNDNGEIFTSCQFFYAGIHVDNSKGIVFGNCLFGRGNDQNGEHVDISDSGLVLFDACSFRSQPNKTVSSSSVVFANCYTWEGNSVTI